MNVRVCYVFVCVSLQRKKTGRQGTNMFTAFIPGCTQYVGQFLFSSPNFSGTPPKIFTMSIYYLEGKINIRLYFIIIIFFLRGIQR